jgi:redox-sensitive bicupin YhaK (pirin superfamily)
MTAGRGILHSEMPEQVDGRMEGFQLWLNLPAARKMTEPAYSDIGPADIPLITLPEGVRVKVIAGEYVSADRAIRQNGAVTRDVTEPLFLDFQFDQSAQIQCQVPAGHNAFVYVCDGQLELGENGQLLSAKKMAILSDGEHLSISGDGGSHAILIAGKPLNEPIAQHGPFVMNTREELMQAVQDLQAGELG